MTNQLKNLKEGTNMFKKQIPLDVLNDITDELWAYEFETKKIHEAIKKVLAESKYSDSVQTKLLTQLTSFYKCHNVKNARLKFEILNRIFRIWNTGGEWEEQLPIYYTLVMLLSHKNFPTLFTTLAQFKKSNSLFTMQIFMNALKTETNTKARTTVYETVNQFLSQLANTECLIKVAHIYKVPTYKTDYELREFIRRTIDALPGKYYNDLFEVFGIEKKEPSSDAFLLWLTQGSNNNNGSSIPAPLFKSNNLSNG